MKKTLLVIVLLVVGMRAFNQELRSLAGEEHHWATSEMKCKFDGAATFVCDASASPHFNFSYIPFDCTETPPVVDTRTEAEKKRDAEVGIAFLSTPSYPKCKLAVLDFCITHGETRVLVDKPTKKE